MIRKYFKSRRLVLGLAVGLAVAAFGAPAVQAATGPAYSLLHRSTQTHVVPTGKYGPLDPWAYAVIHRSTNAIVVPTGETMSRTISAPTPVSTGQSVQSNFNWGDAGIGASVSFGAALLLLTSFGLARRYRSGIDRTGYATS